MKRIAVFLFMLLAVTLVSCGYSETDVALAKTEGFDAGYAEGYAIGYDAGYDGGYEDGHTDGRKEGYLDGFDVGYNAAYSKFLEAAWPEPPADEKPSRPTSGTILSGQEYFNGSEITVTADSSYDYAVAVKTVQGAERVCFYVRAGETVTVGVPAEYLYVYFASGTDWNGYGKGLMFGTDTAYSKDDELMDFAQCSWEYTLTPVNDGNFSETPSNENEFF